MGRKVIDRTGMRFGKLVVIRFLATGCQTSYWECQCDCGAVLTVSGAALKSGKTSCGCGRSEAQIQAWNRRREKAAAARRAKEEKQRAERRHKEFLERQMIRNQEAGMRFDDMWMFGDSHAIERLKTMFH